MIEVQLRDACFSCNGRGTFRSKEVISSMCADCEGLGSIYTWISIEELSNMTAEIQLQKIERSKFPSIEENIFQNSFSTDNDLNITPNPNI
jgi:hypothetical protein